jgi:hypothetical protein
VTSFRSSWAVLKPYLKRKAVSRPLHTEVPHTYAKAAFASPQDSVGRNPLERSEPTSLSVYALR